MRHRSTRNLGSGRTAGRAQAAAVQQATALHSASRRASLSPGIVLLTSVPRDGSDAAIVTASHLYAMGCRCTLVLGLALREEWITSGGSLAAAVTALTTLAPRRPRSRTVVRIASTPSESEQCLGMCPLRRLLGQADAGRTGPEVATRADR